MLITAYFGLLQVGEMTLSEHMIKASNVQISQNKKKLRLILESSKTHGHDKMPQIIKLVGIDCHFNRGESDNICPFATIKQYLSLRRKRKDVNEPFFIYCDRSPVTSYEYRKMLKKLLQLSGFNPQYYDTHSTRSGRAVDLYLIAKLSIETIRKIGRWRSTSIYTYLQTVF